MPLEELKSKIHNTVRSFERRYETNIFFFPEDTTPHSIIHVRLIDLYHDMNLYIQVSLQNLNVLDIGIEEIRVPYSSCPMAAQFYTKLIGFSISKLAKELPDQKVNSCLHLNELVEEATRSFNAAYGFFIKEKIFPNELNEEKMFIGNLNRENRREIARHWWMKDRRVKNSCFSFNSATEQIEFKDISQKIPSFTEIVVQSLKK